MFLKFLTVAGLASFEIYAAIPAGFAFDLSPYLVFLASVAGGIAGAVIMLFLGQRIRKFVARFRKPKEKVKKEGFVHRIWNKYGTVGLGLFGTMTVGAPASIAVGIGFNACTKRLFAWCCVGIIARCIIFTAIGHAGNVLI